jgi:hypothetical protein
MKSLADPGSRRATIYARRPHIVHPHGLSEPDR